MYSCLYVYVNTIRIQLQIDIYSNNCIMVLYHNFQVISSVRHPCGQRPISERLLHSSCKRVIFIFWCCQQWRWTSSLRWSTAMIQRSKMRRASRVQRMRKWPIFHSPSVSKRLRSQPNLNRLIAPPVVSEERLDQHSDFSLEVSDLERIWRATVLIWSDRRAMHAIIRNSRLHHGLFIPNKPCRAEAPKNDATFNVRAWFVWLVGMSVSQILGTNACGLVLRGWRSYTGGSWWFKFYFGWFVSKPPFSVGCGILWWWPVLHFIDSYMPAITHREGERFFWYGGRLRNFVLLACVSQCMPPWLGENL